MALYDNKHYLLSHIWNSFITSDDSGMCEVVMTCDNVARQIEVGKYDCYPNVLEEEEEDSILAQSFDLNSDLQFGLRRPKARMDRVFSSEKKKPNIKHIKWVNPLRPLSNDEIKVFFPHKDVEVVRKENVGKRVSLLTELLAKYPNQPENPFKDYAKLDGNAQVGVPIKKYRIYVTMLPEEIQKFPMEVTIVASAKISDLIGLICWKCSTEFTDVPMKDNVSNYSLFIAEDDGDVDWDFPCLDSQEVISKFGFSFLAIVDRDSIPHSLEETYPAINIETNLHQFAEPSSSVRAQFQREDDMKRFRGQMNALEAPLYQSFSVHVLNKFRVKTEVYLEISGEKVEISPVMQPYFSSARMPTVKLWRHQQAETYSMEDVVACDLTEHKSNHRSTFKLVHWKLKRNRNDEETGKFKTKNFESDTSVAIEIVNKVNHILECRHSVRRQEYITLRERKSHRRKAFLSPR